MPGTGSTTSKLVVLRGNSGADRMREWYREWDLLDAVDQRVIGADSSLDETVRRILVDLRVENHDQDPRSVGR